MKRATLIALALIAFAARGQAQTVVQHKGCTSGAAATSVACAFASNIGAGHLLVYMTGGAESSTLGAPTDNNTNTIVKDISCGDVSQPCNTGGSGTCNSYHVANSNSGATTVTAHATAANSALFVWIAEISGMNTSSPGDQTGDAFSATPSVSTSGSDTNATDLVAALFMDLPNNATLTVGSGYTGDLIANSTDGDAAFGEFKTVSATGVQSATVGGNGTDTLAMCIATFAASGGGGGACGHFGMTQGMGC